MTSDKRREVAEQLREARPSTYYAEELVELIEDALLPAFPTETWREPTDVLASLADLIDPTCHVVPFDEESMRLPHCSRCGQPMLKPWPNHCPNCGARVVADDGK